ncbi:MAG: M14 family metallopeptidase [Planctomycetota bacterium]
MKVKTVSMAGGVLRLALVTLGMGAQGVRAGQDDACRLHSPSDNVPVEWLTTAEQSDFRSTPRYDQTLEYCRRLAQASPWIEYRSFGTSPEGRALPLIIASKDKAFTQKAANDFGKLVVLVQNCIHAGECAGKDASLMLLRDIAVTKQRAGLLDNVVLLVIPIFNVDGHERFSPYSRINQNGPEEMGWRVTSRNLNLNRDYIKADAVEMQAWLRLWNAWRPDLHFDNHTTDGGDWQYDLTYSIDRHAIAARPVVEWLDKDLLPGLLPALKADGHVTLPYFGFADSKDPTKGIRSGGWFAPRLANCYVTLRNRPSVLVETHMLKPYRTRVIAHYNIMQHVLEEVSRNPRALRTAVQASDQATIDLARSPSTPRTLPIGIEQDDESIPLVFKGFACRRTLSEISGDVRIAYDNSRPIDVETTWRSTARIAKEVSLPRAYIIPPQWTEAIELARLHGLECRRLTKPVTAEFGSYRFEDVTFADAPFESRIRARFTAKRIVEERTYLPGSVVVRLDQPAAKIAVHMFEPEAPDSLVSWGFFNAIFEQKEYAEHYVLERLAREMLDADPGLADEFEAKLRNDREFASSPGARLEFFYKRSPYWDASVGTYPVGRIENDLTLPAARTEVRGSSTVRESSLDPCGRVSRRLHQVSLAWQ